MHQCNRNANLQNFYGKIEVNDVKKWNRSVGLLMGMS